MVQSAEVTCDLAGGMVNYTVNQGDTLQVNFKTNTSLVLIGGAKNGGFANTAPCQVTELLTARL